MKQVKKHLKDNLNTLFFVKKERERIHTLLRHTYRAMSTYSCMEENGNTAVSEAKTTSP